MIGSVLAAILLLIIAGAYHVVVLLFCHGDKEDEDQETSK